MHVQMRSQKIANHLTLVRRQIVQNDVGLSRRRPFDHLYEELHKLLAGGILRRSRRVAAAITLSCPFLDQFTSKCKSIRRRSVFDSSTSC